MSELKQLTCLWCKHRYQGFIEDYRFCDNCIGNLGDVENIIGGPSSTDKIEKYLLNKRS